MLDGVFVLRIEDTDIVRSNEESVKAIIDALEWLGINWDEGPYFQSKRRDLYLGAVKKLLDVFSFSVENLVVVHDDIDLEKGALKIKQRGGDGGHNGLKSIISELQSDNFLRVRLGIGRPDTKEDIADYVLSAFGEEDKEWLQSLADRAIKVVETLLTSGITATLNEFNRRS